MEVLKPSNSLSKKKTVSLDEAIFGFINNYKSKYTRKGYLADLKTFSSYLSTNHPSVSVKEVRHAHVIAYRDFLAETLSSKTVVRKLACLKSFYDHLGELSIVVNNPTSRVKRPKTSTLIQTHDFT